MRWLVFILILLTCRTYADTHTAASCSSSDVQTAMNAASSGDVVVIPAGACDWSSKVTNYGKSITIVGAGANLSGTRIHRTIAGTDPAMSLDCGNNTFMTLSGVYWTNGSSAAQYGIVSLNGEARRVGFRVSSNYFGLTGSGCRGIVFWGTYGLVDNCWFNKNASGDTVHGVEPNFDGAGIIATNWHTTQTYGDTNTIVIEDCVFDFATFEDNGLDAYAGTKFVIRNSYWTNTYPGWHGADTDYRGVRLFEIYSNTIATKAAYNMSAAAMARSGSGVFFGNTIVGDFDQMFELRVYRAALTFPDSVGTQFMFLPAGGLNGVADGDSPVDGNFDSSGYPALDQIGRGSFPVGTPWPGQSSYATNEYAPIEGVYQWSNNYNGKWDMTNTFSDWANSTRITNFVRPGRDYWDNTAKPGYTPLIYPHPLRSAESGGGGSVTNFYVATTGNDSAAGTIAAPWLTIQTSIDKMRTNLGCTLWVRGGKYDTVSDVPDFQNFPSNAAPTKFKGYPGETVVLNGGSTASGACGIIDVTNLWWSDMILSNFNIGISVSHQGATSGSIVLSNLTIRYIGQQGIHFDRYAHDCLLVDSTIRDTGQGVSNGEGVYIGNTDVSGGYQVSRITVRNCQIYDVQDEAVDMKPNTRQCVIENCTIHDGVESTAEGAIEIDVDGDYNADPDHIVRNNVLYNLSGMTYGIHVMTGAKVYNNVLHSVGGSTYGIFVDNNSSDSWIRHIYNNTVDHTLALGIVRSAGTWRCTNNIGTNAGANLAINSAYFVDYAGHNYALTNGATPIDAGLDISAQFTTDILGNTRSGAWDMGAYEYQGGASPNAPRNLRVQGTLRVGTIRGS